MRVSSASQADPLLEQKPLGLNYLFGLNSSMNVDAYGRGNMARFLNHATRKDNVVARGERGVDALSL